MVKYQKVFYSLYEPITVRALVARGKFLYIGTESGKVLILDAASGTLVRRLNRHHAPIKDISPDEQGEYVATCCQGGVVIVQSIHDEAEYYKKEYSSRAVNCIAIHPHYGSTEGKSFVVGCAKGLQPRAEKTILGPSYRFPRARREGKVHAVAWKGEIVVMGCDTGVVMCSMKNKKVVARFERSQFAPRAELFRCNIYWENAASVIVAWGNDVRIYRIREVKLKGRLTNRVFSSQYEVKVDCGFATDVGRSPIQDLRDSAIPQRPPLGALMPSLLRKRTERVGSANR